MYIYQGRFYCRTYRNFYCVTMDYQLKFLCFLFCTVFPTTYFGLRPASRYCTVRCAPDMAGFSRIFTSLRETYRFVRRLSATVGFHDRVLILTKLLLSKHIIESVFLHNGLANRSEKLHNYIIIYLLAVHHQQKNYNNVRETNKKKTKKITFTV